MRALAFRLRSLLSLRHLGKLFAALATAHKWSRTAYTVLGDERDPRIDCDRCWSSAAIWTQLRRRPPAGACAIATPGRKAGRPDSVLVRSRAILYCSHL